MSYGAVPSGLFSSSMIVSSDAGVVSNVTYAIVPYVGSQAQPFQSPVPVTLSLSRPSYVKVSSEVGFLGDAVAAPDDGAIIALAGITSSGIPSGPNVTVTNISGTVSTLRGGGIGMSYLENSTLPDGTTVTTSYSWLYGAPSNVQGEYPSQIYSRSITITPPTRPVESITIDGVRATKFDPAAGESTTLTFDIAALPTNYVKVNSWTVFVEGRDADGATVSNSFRPGADPRGPGTVTAASNGTLQVSLPWNGRDPISGAVTVGNLTWTLYADATDFVFNGPPGGAAQTGLTFIQELQSNPASVVITNPSANDFDPSAGENTTLNFDVTTTGLTDPTINWDVTVRDSNDAFFANITHGSNNDGSTSVHIQTPPWNGKNAAGNVIEGTFTWVIAANTTAVAAGGGGTSLQAKEVAFLSSALGKRLEFRQDGKKVSTVEPSFLYSVSQFQEYIKRVGDQEPGTAANETLDLGKPSVVEIRFTPDKSLHLTYPTTLTLKVVGDPRSGGHAHAVPGAAAPVGQFSPTVIQPPADVAGTRVLMKSIADSVGQNLTTTFRVSGDGQTARVYWVAPIASGTYSFAVSDNSGSVLDRGALDVQKAGLQPLQDALSRAGVGFVIDLEQGPKPPPGGDVVLTGENTARTNVNHPKNHYGTPELNQKLAALVKRHLAFNKQRLWFNDQSLIFGGKFDVLGYYARPNFHYEHRNGDNIDINAIVVRRGIRDPRLEQSCADVGLAVYGELDEAHYHLRLLKKR